VCRPSRRSDAACNASTWIGWIGWIGTWMWLRTSVIGGRSVIAFDGKTLRGARDAAGNLVHLLSGISQQTGVVLGQCTVGAKTNEIPLLSQLLDTMDITRRCHHRRCAALPT
jgi:hypothetical protein